jgi:hypothetical protein
MITSNRIPFKERERDRERMDNISLNTKEILQPTILRCTLRSNIKRIQNVKVADELNSYYFVSKKVSCCRFIHQ